MLRNGYGFEMEDNITATDVVNGQKVGWALGSMLYEINTLPWTYIPRGEVNAYNEYMHRNDLVFYLIGTVMLICVTGFCFIYKSFNHRHHKYPYQHQYSPIDDVKVTQHSATRHSESEARVLA